MKPVSQKNTKNKNKEIFDVRINLTEYAHYTFWVVMLLFIIPMETDWICLIDV